MMLTTASKVNAAKRYARNGQYPEAVLIAEKIQLSKVSSIHELSALAGIFLKVKQYDEAKAAYLEMYSRAKTHKVMVGLIDLCLKTQEPKLAEKYLREFRKMEPENPERLVFRYRVDCMLGKSNEYLLKSLTKLKEEDYTDIWALELAKIYYKENDMVACAKECRDILLWFPDSEVVPKAKVLLGACEDIFEEAEAEPEEAAAPIAENALPKRAAGSSVDVVEITNSGLSGSEPPRKYEAELEASIADTVAGMLDGEEFAEELAAEEKTSGELAAEAKTSEELAAEGEPSVELVPETRSAVGAPFLYDRIIYDDEDDEDDEEYVIRDYFVKSAEPLPADETLADAENLSEEAPADTESLSEEAPADTENLSEEAPADAEKPPKEVEPESAEGVRTDTAEEECRPVIELPVIGVPMQEPDGEEAPAQLQAEKDEQPEAAAEDAVRDLSKLRVEELVFDPDSSVWEEPDDGLLRDDNPEKWMQDVNITANAAEPPREEREASERDLTEAALAAMFREDDVAIERALYDLLKKD